jgi:uncharacterized protein (TIGR00725 family)
MSMSTPRDAVRRPTLSVIGNGGALDHCTEALCVDLGRRAIEAGMRVVSGGLGGVMEAVSRGARSAERWHEGDIIGVLPGYDRRTANAYVDIAVPTGMQIGRNVIVAAMADVVVMVGGGAGTLSEAAIAWQLGKPIIALASTGGWANALAAKQIDDRRADLIHRAETAEEAIAVALRLAASGDGG